MFITDTETGSLSRTKTKTIKLHCCRGESQILVVDNRGQYRLCGVLSLGESQILERHDDDSHHFDWKVTIMNIAADAISHGESQILVQESDLFVNNVERCAADAAEWERHLRQRQDGSATCG